MSKAKLVTTIDLCLTSEDSQTADSDISVINVPTMQTDQEKSPHKKSSDKSDSDSAKSTKKAERKKESDSKDKPRIVLTFRSEKPGAKSSSMKIVSTEEKHEEISPRRSTRLGTKGESDYECEVTVNSKSQPVSEAEEPYENSPPKRPQRSTRSRNSDSDAHWNSRKESQSDVSVSSAQRPSRRIKPTAKVLANQEMQVDTQHRSSKDGVRTRSTRSTTKSAVTPEMEEEVEESQSEKLEHLEGLGLKAREGTTKAKEETKEEDASHDDQDLGENQESEEEVDDDLDVITKLLEEEDDSEDDDFVVSKSNFNKPTPVSRPRRRAAPTYKLMDSDEPYISKKKKLRSTVTSDEEDEDDEIIDEPEAETAEESQEAAQPEAGAAVAAACHCLRRTNIHAAPDDLTEPVFCQAIDSVDGVRVGCSHGAARETREVARETREVARETREVARETREVARELKPLLRAGPRAPYILVCDLHETQMRRHMCCPTCGLFCTQGSFYQCSLGHLFHAECGVAGAAGAAGSVTGGAAGSVTGGCPHCGVRGRALHCPLGAPVNCDVTRVTITINCSNKNHYLPNQREQCTPAFLSFTPLKSVEIPEGPVIPEDLLPPSSVDIVKLCKEADKSCTGDETEVLKRLVDGIIAGETMELVPKIVSARKFDLNKAIDDSGNTLCHLAATRGRLLALHLLRGAGAGIDVPDTELRTPLIAAVEALLDKSPKPNPIKESDKEQEQNKNEEEIKMEVDDDGEEAETTLAEVKAEIVLDDSTEKEIASENVDEVKETQKAVKQKTEDKPKKVESVIDKQTDNDVDVIDSAKDEDLLKVIRYLIAAGADVNFVNAEGTSALHVAAQHGGAAAAALLLQEGRARLDLPDSGGWTPLVHAAENDHLHVLQLLLQRGADAGVRDAAGDAALHWAAARGAARCLAALLHHAPLHLHLPNHAGDTPLHIACRQNHYACVAALLARGARTDLANSARELPLEVSRGASRACVSLHMQAAIAAGATNVETILCDDISNGREPHTIPCVNGVDAAPAPTDFNYVAELLTPAPVQLDTTINTMKGCSCTGDCSSGCACTAVSVRRWYRGGRLLPSFPLHDPPLLFECNATCKCNPRRCTNNVVGRLLRTGSVWAPCVVYRAGGARGWGLRCAGAVPRGSPVAAYTGELLPAELADARDPDHYMFAIDVKADLLEQCAERRALCVDAAAWGGAARFMNHSCAPALVPLRVLAAARDLRAPAIALFAARDLPPGTPLTFDYGDKFWSVKSKYISCECGEPNCRYPTKTEDES